MDGAELASYYAFAPNQRGYCGTAGFVRALKRHLAKKGDLSALRRELGGFSAHFAYLSLIARENGLKPFDLDVVRALWTGNSLLENVRPDSLRSFIQKDLFASGQPKRAKKLCGLLPEGIVPHHSFNVLYINFVSNSVPRTLRNFDSCAITWGKVLSASKDSVRLLRASIGWNRGFALLEKECSIALSRNGIRFVGELKKGDVVSVHWGMAVEKLASENGRLLEKYTIKNIRAINDSGRMTGAFDEIQG